MIVALTGDNAYALNARLRELVDAFVAEHGDLALERVDGTEADLARIREAVTSLPFLASKKLVVLRTPSSQKQFLESFEQLLGEVPETNDVIIVEPKLDKRLVYYKFLKKLAGFQEFIQMDAGGLANWLTTEAKAQGGQLSSGDARYLVDRIGPNQQLLTNELDKLLLHDPKITRQAIEELTDQSPQTTVFELLEAAFAGKTKRALAIYQDQRAQQAEPAQIIAMLAWQLHVLAVIKTAGERSIEQIAKDAKLNPYVLRKSQGIARSLTLASLKERIHDLLKIDIGIKRSALDADEALQLYLLKLAT